jgi:hypothetical protein
MVASQRGRGVYTCKYIHWFPHLCLCHVQARQLVLALVLLQPLGVYVSQSAQHSSNSRGVSCHVTGRIVEGMRAGCGGHGLL